MKIIQQKDLPCVSTSHDETLMKYVLAAKDEFPPGKMAKFQQLRVNKHFKFFPEAEQYVILVISSGTVSVNEQQLSPHDMIVFSPSDIIPELVANDAIVYVIFWTPDLS